ncbi:DUF1361 domain-containing protein [Leptospira yasudae]|uniref:DUF1361 domain-containing protein n=2 Tax=Leptospira yasudae TaxID=2202201 RepID=A0ABX9M318_9LEPT|nr:DUF1361 domain-containing protein [Leptospira yasudae]
MLLPLSLFISCALSLVLIELRIVLSGKQNYVFLKWNLILALIPVLIAYFLWFYYEVRKRSIDFFFVLLILVWLVFFPNSPYIVSDFILLKSKPGIPLWFDILLIFSFAWNGLFSGYLSLRIIHNLLNDEFNAFVSWLFVSAVAPLTALGIYIGRFYRWNSWDIITNPLALYEDMIEILIRIRGNQKLLGILVLMSVSIFFGYLIIYALTRFSSHLKKNEA